MKNNIKALVIHLIIVILSSVFQVIFVATGPTIGLMGLGLRYKRFKSI